ncbi:MAG: FCD domain-containing protein [Alphaproteobacteria bacterium]|nr:FCD domain-containing protein [Alphaproteobacteria bacterium]
MTESRETIRLLRSRSLSGEIQSEIERRILYGELRAGARLNENALAAELEVSRGPVREACRGLVEAGLLTVIVNRGFFVREISLKEVSDVYDVRASLARLTGETLAARITTDQLSTLARLVDEMDDAERRDDSERFYQLNIEFHDRIVDYTENDRLRAISEGLVKELHLYRRRSLLLGGGLKVSNREHRRILSALRTRDPTQAGASLEQHILAAKRRFLAATEA